MSDLVDFSLLTRLAVALAVGLLIGAERGWEGRALAEGKRAAGIRTFGLVSLFGGLCVQLEAAAGGWVTAAGFFALAGLAWLAYRQKLQEANDISATTAVALLMAYALGALAGAGQLEAAGATAVVVTLLLGSKPELHGLLAKADRREVAAVLKLLLISVVLLPILPDQGYGPWQSLNPYKIWWMVVLIAGISFSGYVAIRIFGSEKGVLLTALLGGLVTSTATSMNLARLGAKRKTGHSLLAAGVLLASGTMFARMLLVSAVVEPQVALRLAPAMIAALVGCYGVAYLAWRGSRNLKADETLLPGNPFEFWVAVQFGLLLAAILLMSQALQAWLGAAGLYLLGAVSGLADVDAITLSYSSMVGEGRASLSSAGLGMMIAAASNTFVKGGLVQFICGGEMARWVAAGFAAALVLAFGVYWLPIPGITG
ncbi:MgtC/SapB family protein [Limibacillus halophilus]